MRKVAIGEDNKTAREGLEIIELTAYFVDNILYDEVAFPTNYPFGELGISSLYVRNRHGPGHNCRIFGFT